MEKAARRAREHPAVLLAAGAAVSGEAISMRSPTGGQADGV